MKLYHVYDGDSDALEQMESRAIWADSKEEAVGYWRGRVEDSENRRPEVQEHKTSATPVTNVIHEELRFNEVLRPLGWRYEDDHECQVCGLFFGDGEWCDICEMCRECAKEENGEDMCSCVRPADSDDTSQHNRGSGGEP